VLETLWSRSLLQQTGKPPALELLEQARAAVQISPAAPDAAVAVAAA
jgi:hypothetical protein